MFCRTNIKLIRLAILFIWQSVSIVTIAKSLKSPQALLRLYKLMLK